MFRTERQIRFLYTVETINNSNYVISGNTNEISNNSRLKEKLDIYIPQESIKAAILPSLTLQKRPAIIIQPQTQKKY